MGVEALPKRALGRRIGAAFIDLFVFWTAYWLVFLVVADTAPAGFEPSGGVNLRLSLGDTTHYLTGGGAAGYTFAWIGVAVVYFGVLPGLTGWTPGKVATGLRVVKADGSGAGVGANIGRALSWVVDGFPYFLPGLVGFVMILAGGGRRVADRITSTYVVKASDLANPPAAGAPAAAAAPPTAPAAGWYPDPEVPGGQRWWDGAAWTEHRA